ncbi:MAG TPA: M50 family metallopeptidase [Chloroflexota bacterium]
MLYLRVALLAPGVMLHELAHHLFCLLTGVKVHKVVYFRLGSPAGFVVHEEPELYRQIFAIVAGPVFLNSAMSIVMVNLALRQSVRATDWQGFALAALMVWLGLSAALQAIPSRADAINLFRSSNRHLLRANPAALIGYPVALLIYLVQAARPLGSEWYYAVGMAYIALQGFSAVPNL